MRGGAAVTYTDGMGRVGEGTYASGSVIRGPEHEVPRVSTRVTVAVAPPSSKDRVRFLVEKLAELGVADLVWVKTRFSEGRTPNPDKTSTWIRSAVEQSRGAWTMSTREADIRDLRPPILVADLDGVPLLTATSEATVLIGPEGGFDPAELPPDAMLVSLGHNVLRVETAAIAAAAVLLCR